MFQWLTSVFTGRSVWCWLDIQTLVLLCFNWFILTPRMSASWSVVTSGLYVQIKGFQKHLTLIINLWDSVYILANTLCLPCVQVSRRPNFKELSQDHARCQRWLNKKRIKAFYTSVLADNLRHGTQFLLQVWTSAWKVYSSGLMCFPLVLCCQVYQVKVSLIIKIVSTWEW